VPGRLVALFAFAAMLVGCASGPPAPVEPGQWYDSGGDPVAQAMVQTRIAEADLALLGEVHDSRPVHDKQVEMLRQLDASRVLALEHLDLGTEPPALDGAPDARTLAEQAGFDFEGWGWSHYSGLFRLAATQRWPLWPINLPRREAIAVAMANDDEWRAPLEPAQVEAIERFPSTLVLPEPAQSSLIEDLRQAHCGDIDAGMARAMARAQIARDILMADALVRAVDRYPERRVIAVMGNQHARVDRGVGYWLDRPGMAFSGDVVSIGMLPVDSFDRLRVAAGTYDFVWITAPVEREIDCGGRS